ncbi:hypothetical protein CesoFtcFv8_006954 [Champsocephalus esox]|uniref:Uncharacterized protein n=1 Tax=Champsocephalus esox TaxID=159716 RepID=A0AAN8CFR2_9TELE|nr:hypothetical protein CesoFtcFv8_006954 [Champsocephalus esox]
MCFQMLELRRRPSRRSPFTSRVKRFSVSSRLGHLVTLKVPLFLHRSISASVRLKSGPEPDVSDNIIAQDTRILTYTSNTEGQRFSK